MKSYCLPSRKPLKNPLSKRKNTQLLTTQKLLKMAKRETNQNLTLHRPIKIAKCRKTQNLTLKNHLN